MRCEVVGWSGLVVWFVDPFVYVMVVIIVMLEGSALSMAEREGNRLQRVVAFTARDGDGQLS